MDQCKQRSWATCKPIAAPKIIEWASALVALVLEMKLKKLGKFHAVLTKRSTITHLQLPFTFSPCALLFRRVFY